MRRGATGCNNAAEAMSMPGALTEPAEFDVWDVALEAGKGASTSLDRLAALTSFVQDRLTPGLGDPRDRRQVDREFPRSGLVGS